MIKSVGKFYCHISQELHIALLRIPYVSVKEKFEIGVWILLLLVMGALPIVFILIGAWWLL